MEFFIIFCIITVLMVISLQYINTRNYNEDQIKLRERIISTIFNILIIVFSSSFVYVYFSRGIDLLMVAIPGICYYCIFSIVILYFEAKRCKKDTEKLWNVFKKALLVLGSIAFLLLLSFIIRYWIFN